MKTVLLALATLAINSLYAQHTINGTLTPADNYQYVFLYECTPDGSNYIDKGDVSPDGTFSINLKPSQPKGLYKIVYGMPIAENNFEIIYNGEEDIAFNFSTEKGVEFSQSNENKLWLSYRKSMELINSAMANFYMQHSTDKAAYNQIIQTLKNTQASYEEAASGTMVQAFITSNKPYIPERYEDLKTYFENVRIHFWEHMDFSNNLIQSSDFLTEKVFAFVFEMAPNASEAFYKSQINNLATSIDDANKNLKAVLLELVWQEFVNQEQPTIANYITTEYLAQLATETQNEILYLTITNYRDTAIGATALDFPIETQENGKPLNTTLHQLSGANQYLLIFWSSTCGHCLNELPKVHDYIKQFPKNTVKVIAFAIEETQQPWAETIKQFPDFMHLYGAGKWDNPTAKAYGVNATPNYFLLDKDKHIIAKPFDFEALKKELPANQKW